MKYGCINLERFSNDEAIERYSMPVNADDAFLDDYHDSLILHETGDCVIQSDGQDNIPGI